RRHHAWADPPPAGQQVRQAAEQHDDNGEAEPPAERRRRQCGRGRGGGRTRGGGGAFGVHVRGVPSPMVSRTSEAAGGAASPMTTARERSGRASSSLTASR